MNISSADLAKFKKYFQFILLAMSAAVFSSLKQTDKEFQNLYVYALFDEIIVSGYQASPMYSQTMVGNFPEPYTIHNEC